MLRFPSPTCRYPGVYKGGMSITRSLSIIQMPLSPCNTTLEDDPPDEMICVCADGCEVVEGWPGERRVAERSGLISARNFRVTGYREGLRTGENLGIGEVPDFFNKKMRVFARMVECMVECRDSVHLHSTPASQKKKKEG